MKVTIEVSKYNILAMAYSMGYRESCCKEFEKYIESNEEILNPAPDLKQMGELKEAISAVVVVQIARELGFRRG